MSISPNDNADVEATRWDPQITARWHTDALSLTHEDSGWDVQDSRDTPTRRPAEADAIDWLSGDDITACECISFAITLPTHYNPSPGRPTGDAIPPCALTRIKQELCRLTQGVTSQSIEQLYPPLLVMVVDGDWEEPDSLAPDGYAHYVDGNALRVVANVEVRYTVAFKQRLLLLAARWADQLQQRALYIEEYGCGRVRHYFVRPAPRLTQCEPGNAG